MPKLKSEAEEAQWWDAHMRDVETNLVEGIQERRESKNITIRVAVSDIERARALAAEKGIGYQTFMKMLLKEALDRESGAGFARPKTRVR